MRASFAQGAACALVVVGMLAVRDASGQDADVEPLGVDYTAPDGCPPGSSFFSEITARTPRARAARSGERARVLHVKVTRRGERHVGTLAIEDTTGTGSAREVSGGTCAEVVGALALVAALAVDPHASVAPRPPPTPTPPPATATSQPAGATSQPATATSQPATATSQPATAPPERRAAPSTPGEPTGGPPPEPAVRDRPRERERTSEPRDTRPRRARFGAGAAGEIAMVADAVASLRVFGDLEISRGIGDRDLFAPTFRLAVARSLDRDVSSSVGGATLRWTQVGVDVCPFRLVLASPLSVRACVAGSAGTIEADAIQSRARPWASLGAHARLVWAATAALAIEAEAGGITPLFRESFFFEPSVPVYEAPIAAFVGRFGASLHFP